jgi:16S rRNA (guanine966-N2)-methyltransferase
VRIIAGTAKGRRLFTPARTTGRAAIRPTADRAREALFSIIGPASTEALVLDLFAGTGAMGLEALSRGAEQALFVDATPQALNLIRRNIENCGFGANSRVLQRDLSRKVVLPEEFIPADGFSLVFLDPPYGKGLGLQVLRELSGGALITSSGIVVVEDMAQESYPEQLGCLHLFDHRRYGEAAFWLYMPREGT